MKPIEAMPYYSIKQAAKKLNCDVETLLHMHEVGQLELLARQNKTDWAKCSKNTQRRFDFFVITPQVRKSNSRCDSPIVYLLRNGELVPKAPPKGEYWQFLEGYLEGGHPEGDYCVREGAELIDWAEVLVTHGELERLASALQFGQTDLTPLSNDIELTKPNNTGKQILQVGDGRGGRNPLNNAIRKAIEKAKADGDEVNVNVVWNYLIEDAVSDSPTSPMVKMNGRDIELTVGRTYTKDQLGGSKVFKEARRQWKELSKVKQS